MLYVVLTSEYPRTIIIDEPNTFLHPGAARKLIEILKEFPQHQYIVSTHSPEILKAADPDSLTLIRWDKPQSKIEQLDPKEVKDTKKCLVEVGAKLSDVFGADNILWVEGETEEQCFPLILQGKYPRFGTNIVRIRNTGELEAKRGLAEKIWDIYRRLSTGSSLIPPAVSFVLDQEGRTPEQMERLISISDGLVHFLPRRTYENYLLNPSALLAVTRELSNFYKTPITEGDISKWFAENGGKTKYLDPAQATVDPSNKEWLEKVHGAKLLIDYFQEFSQGRYSYKKTDHSFELTKWLIENERKTLEELEGFLIRILEKGEKLN